jgi:hypothetical protein
MSFIKDAQMVGRLALGRDKEKDFEMPSNFYISLVYAKLRSWKFRKR